MIPTDHLLAMDVKETSGLRHVITHNGVEVHEYFYGDGIWRIEHYLPKSNNHCLMLHKDIKQYYKAKIISKQIDCGILAPCYVGY